MTKLLRKYKMTKNGNFSLTISLPPQLRRKKNGLPWKYVAFFYKYLKMFSLVCFIANEIPTANGIFDKPRKTALLEGDILLGALVSVHHQPQQKTARLLECGEIREQYGIQRVEAAFLAIDRINNDPNLLPNISLGIEIRDSCWYSSIALEQSIEFIRDAITGPDGGINSTRHSPCPRNLSPANKNLVGVVGPGSSAVTIQVQNLLQLFGIPQVGYSATSRDLSDKSRFPYFQRVVPSDYYQAQVMVDIVQHYNWTYVSAVHTDGNYGQSGMTAFRELAESSDICIAKEDSVLSNAENEAFDEVIRQLAEDSRANVVVCFCEGMTVRNLLMAAIRLHHVHRFLFLGSDGWADRSDVVAGLEEAAIGGLSVKIQSSYVTGFDDYYFNLNPANNTRNPWFREFWEYRFNCTFSGNDSHTNHTDTLKQCTGEEKLSEGYKQDTKMAFVVKAIYTMAYGLHNLHKDFCRGKVGLCKGILPINGSLFRDYLMNVTFSYLNETVSFDSRGDPPGRYAIMNFQRLANGSFDYVNVGSWDNGTLTMDESLVVFNGSDQTPPMSICAKLCDPGQVKSFVDTGDHTQICCWTCNDCEEDEYLESETKCSQCGKDHWPNSTKTGCDPIPVEYLDWNYDGSIAALTIASMGLLATLFTMFVFIQHNDTPIVKASTRELTYIIFMGMMVSYLSSLPLLHMPSTYTCAFSRVLPGLSFSMIYAALVTKTNRIARILAGNKKIMIRKLKFLSATSQVVITLILISIEVFIIIFMLFYQPPEAVKSYPRSGKVVLICNTTPLGVIAPMGWDFFLIGLCTLYAIKTRNLPENFNEAKFIGFSMYTTCVIWSAWVPIYFGSNHKVISLSICTSLSAFVTLVLLFFPKIYIILCRPDKNDRSAFTTAKNVRCHIGSASKNPKLPDKGKAALVESPSCTSSVYVSAADSKWSGLLLRVRGVVQQGGPPKAPISQQLMYREPNPKTLLKRETSVWSDISQSSVVQHRDYLLNKAYGSQLDLADFDPGTRWGHSEKGSQTCDELLDPLIPRMRRRVVRAVREGTLSTTEGREFFSLTHGWMQAQAEAARTEYQKMKDVEAAAKLAEQQQKESFENCAALSKNLSKKKSWEMLKMEADKEKQNNQTRLESSRSLMSRLLGKNSKSSLIQVLEISESDDNKCISNIEKLNSPTIIVPEVSMAILTCPVETQTNSLFTNSLIANQLNSQYNEVSMVTKPESSGNEPITSSSHLVIINPISELVDLSGHPSQIPEIEMAEKNLLTRVTEAVEMKDMQISNIDHVESPFISVQPSYFFVVDGNFENAERISPIHKQGPGSFDWNGKEDNFKMLSNELENNLLPYVPKADDHCDDSELKLEYPTEATSEDSIPNSTNYEDRMCSNEISSAPKENELIILSLLKQRSLMNNENVPLKNRIFYDPKLTVSPTNAQDKKRDLLPKLGNSKSNLQHSHELNMFLEKNGSKFNEYSYSNMDPHIINNYKDDSNHVKYLNNGIPENAMESSLYRPSQTSSDLFKTSTYIKKAEKILSDYKLAMESSFPEAKANDPKVSDSLYSSSNYEVDGFDEEELNGIKRKLNEIDNLAKGSDNPNGTPSYAYKAHNAVKQNMPQYRSTVTIPLRMGTTQLHKWNGLGTTANKPDHKYLLGSPNPHISIVPEASKSSCENSQIIRKNSLDYDNESFQISFELDNDYEKCNRLDSSECETDDSTNLEDFFRVRGMSFARTSRKAKKL